MDHLLSSPPKPMRTVTLDGTRPILNPLVFQQSCGPGISPLSSRSSDNSNFVNHALASNSEEMSCISQGEEQSSLVYEGVLVDQCIQNVLSLPEEVGEVAQQNHNLTVEINKQQEILSRVKVSLNVLKEQKDELQQEVNGVTRTICLVQGDVGIKSKRCDQLQKEIETLIVGNSNMKARVIAEKKKLEKETKMYEEYIIKMEDHVKIVNEAESTYPINVELSEELKKVEILRQEKSHLELHPEDSEKIMNGTYERILHSDIKGLKVKQIRMEREARTRMEKLNSEKNRQAQIRQDIDILHKRNQAQLTRLKRQVKEAHVRNRQWNEEACQLERSIAELRQHIEE
ncbi:coiled-coil domain-containing protein 122-like [Glandiceps talaboti]